MSTRCQRRARARERHLAAEDAREEPLSCKTCTTIVLVPDTYCQNCASYWQDVENGLFDDYD